MEGLEILAFARITSAPSALRFDNCTMIIFAIGSDNGLWYLRENVTTRNKWTPCRWNSKFCPYSRCLDYDGIAVFVRGTDYDKDLRFVSSNGTGWNVPKTLGGEINSTHAVVKWENGTLAVFVRGTDNGLWYLKGNGTNWINWKSLGGELNSAPSATRLDNGGISVFALGSDKHVKR